MVYSSRSFTSNKSFQLPNPTTHIEYKGMSFLIMDAPSDSNILLYVKELKKYRVTDLVRVCDPTYCSDHIERNGINVHSLVFPDGASPPTHVISGWLSLVRRVFSKCAAGENKSTIAVHCVAGLGRAPVLVAIALIDYGMAPLDSVLYIRQWRKGALNQRQLEFIENYSRRKKSSRCVVL